MVWNEANVNRGSGWGLSQASAETRVFFTNRRLVTVRLVSIVSPGFVGVTLAVQAAELERKRQNERMRNANLDDLLRSDPKNAQVGYDQVTELTYDGKWFRVKSGSATLRLQPVKSGGMLPYAHPDAVADPRLLMAQTIEALKGVPALAGKIVVKP